MITRTFMAFLTQQGQEVVQMQAERAASQYEAALDTLKNSLVAALPLLVSENGVADPALHQRFVDASAEYVSLQTFAVSTTKAGKVATLGEAFTANLGDKNFEDKDPAKTGEHLRVETQKWLKAQLLKGKKPTKGKSQSGSDDTPNILVESFAESTGLPLVAIAVRSASSANQTYNWAVLALWQTSLIKALPKAPSISAAAIDSKGKVFTAADLSDMINRVDFASKSLVRGAQKAKGNSGFESEYRDGRGRRRIGAFYKIPRYDISVVVEQDAEPIHAVARRVAGLTALWGLLFLVGAALLALALWRRLSRGLGLLSHAAGRIASGDFKYQIAGLTGDEVGSLALVINHMARKIADVFQTQAEKARLETELETSRVAEHMFSGQMLASPPMPSASTSVSLAAFHQAAYRSGGDFWGRHSLGDGREMLFIGDAMGFGAQAAMVAAATHAAAIAIADALARDPAANDSPALMLERLNRIVHRLTRGEATVTCFVCVIDIHRLTVTFANGGHCFPVIIPRHPGDDRTKGKARLGGLWPIALNQTGTLLGLDLDAIFKDRSMPLKPGDKLFFFTDGLIECSNPEGQAWGRKHLFELAVAAARHNAEGMRDEIQGKASTFFNSKPLDDDLTLVVAEIPTLQESEPASKRTHEDVVTESSASLKYEPFKLAQLVLDYEKSSDVDAPVAGLESVVEVSVDLFADEGPALEARIVPPPPKPRSSLLPHMEAEISEQEPAIKTLQAISLPPVALPADLRTSDEEAPGTAIEARTQPTRPSESALPTEGPNKPAGKKSKYKLRLPSAG